VEADTPKLEVGPLPDTTGMPYYPFEIDAINGRYSIMAFLESNKLYPRYYNLFKNYGYEGNGPCWEGHIRLILEKSDKDLLAHITFDPEAGSFFAYADSRESQMRFVEILAPIFADTKRLEGYVKVADHSRIDD
jgi:hypothetical protein